MKYSYLLIIPISLVISIIFAGVKKEAAKAEKNADEGSFIVRQSKIFMWIGIVCALVFVAFIILMTLYPNDTASLFVYLIFLLFFFLGLFIAAYCIFWELKVEGNELRYTTLFRPAKTFTFNDLKKVKMKSPNTQNEQIILYSDAKKLLSVYSYCIGYNTLVDCLRSEHIWFD